MQSSASLNEFKTTHKVFAIVLIVQFILSIIIGFLTDTLVLGAGVGFLIIVVPIILGLSQAHSALSRHAVAIATQLMASLHIQQTMGMTEMHFQVFVMLAFITFFRDWKIIITATLVIAVHHILGFVVQSMDGALIVYEEGRLSIVILLIHAAFAVIECIVLGFMVHRNQKEHKVALRLSDAVNSIMNTDGTVNLSEENIPKEPELHDLSSMLLAVRDLANQSSIVGTQLVALAGKVKHASDDLDSTVEEQNSQVLTISESMKNIVDSISGVAELSQSTNAIASNAKTSTQDTTTSIEQSSSNIGQLKATLQTTSTTISDLSIKCENISSVMQSIKSIAEQTNLLALNAAIESARAGEHGRGFAVVADEVRNLAIKSKESAEEIEKITALLTDSANHSVKNMNNCVEIVELAVSSSESVTANMTEVISNIQQVTENVTDVAESASEQSNVSKSISKSTDHLSVLFVSEREQVGRLQQDVHELNSLAEELGSKLKRFSL